MTEGRVVREEDRAQDGDGRNGRTEIASTKLESCMYCMMTMVCGSVQWRLCEEIRPLYDYLKKFQIWGKKVSDVVIFGVIYLRSSGTSVLVVVVP